MYTAVVSKTVTLTDVYICINIHVFGTTDVYICINWLYLWDTVFDADVYICINGLYLRDTVFDTDVYICRIKDDVSHRWIHLYQRLCLWYDRCTHLYQSIVQPVAFGVSFLHSEIAIDDLVLWVSFTTFRSNETKEIEIGDWDWMTLQVQQAVSVRHSLWYRYIHLSYQGRWLLQMYTSVSIYIKLWCIKELCRVYEGVMSHT